MTLEDHEARGNGCSLSRAKAMIAATISNKLVGIDVPQPVGALGDGQTRFVDVIGKDLKWDSCHKASPG